MPCLDSYPNVSKNKQHLLSTARPQPARVPLYTHDAFRGTDERLDSTMPHITVFLWCANQYLAEKNEQCLCQEWAQNGPCSGAYSGFSERANASVSLILRGSSGRHDMFFCMNTTSSSVS